MGAVAGAASGLEILDREECLRLLAAHDFGRLAINVRSEVPTVRPVNYWFDQRTESIVLRTAYGSKFQGILLAHKAAFEIPWHRPRDEDWVERDRSRLGREDR